MAIGCRQSKPIPAEIVGDSMAPLLCGDHLSQRCPQCDCVFVCRTSADLNTVVCDFCGSQFAPQGAVLPADHVQVTPEQLPQRWDIIAFEHDGSTMIKRVVGLPGETVSIAGGNVVIDQNVAVQPDAVSTQTRYLVFDSRHRTPATSNGPANYEFNARHWQSQNGTLTHRQRETSGQDYDWVKYRHHRNYRHFTDASNAPTETQWSTIQDNNRYNQNVGRKLHDVHELAVRLDLIVDQGSTLKIQTIPTQGTASLTFEVAAGSPEYRLELSSGNPIATAEGTLKRAEEGPFEVSLLFSNMDRRIKAAINGKVLIDQPVRFEGPAPQIKLREPQLKFGFSDSSWGSVTRCQIWRDIHYFAVAGPPKFELPLTLGQGDYFVLGDNVAVSRDSRHFGPIKKVIGVVKP